MDDLISRQAVEDITWEEPSYTDPLNVLTEVREKVRASPSVENKGEWIPVTERLPENNDDVLVYDGSDIFVAWYSGIDLDWCSADNRFDEYTPILVWQPLPEPYNADMRGDTE